MPDTDSLKREPATSIRLPANIRQLWNDTAKRMGQTRTAALIEALRLLAQREGVAMRDIEENNVKA